MIEGLNDSKKRFWIWSIVTLSVFLVLYVGLIILLTYYDGSDESAGISDYLLVAALIYPFSTYPMGFFVRRKVMKGYVHVPTEKLRVFESSLIVSSFRWIECLVLTAVNLFLLCFYLTASVLFGIFIFPYHIISGIVFLIKKKI